MQWIKLNNGTILTGSWTSVLSFFEQVTNKTKRQGC